MQTGKYIDRGEQLWTSHRNNNNMLIISTIGTIVIQVLTLSTLCIQICGE